MLGQVVEPSWGRNYYVWRLGWVFELGFVLVQWNSSKVAPVSQLRLFKVSS